jgi:hypothetical protein
MTGQRARSAACGRRSPSALTARPLQKVQRTRCRSAQRSSGSVVKTWIVIAATPARPGSARRNPRLSAQPSDGRQWWPSSAPGDPRARPAAASPVQGSTAGCQVGTPLTRDVPGCHSARRGNYASSTARTALHTGVRRRRLYVVRVEHGSDDYRQNRPTVPASGSRRDAKRPSGDQGSRHADRGGTRITDSRVRPRTSGSGRSGSSLQGSPSPPPAQRTEPPVTATGAQL